MTRPSPRRIWKFTIPPDYASLPITVPAGAHIIHTGAQNGVPTLWCEVDPSGPLEDRYFFVYGTGQDLPPRSLHIGTYFDGPFVWHIYEILHRDPDADSALT